MDPYYELGTYTRPVTTSSSTAQRWFDRGLVWAYGFHHDEAVRCFRHAIEHDPDCVMAYWGVAYALGCNYNKPWEAFAPGELDASIHGALTALAEAEPRLDRASAVERALVRAVRRRFPGETRSRDATAFTAWNDAYADAMREVHAEHTDDHDVATLCAEALMNRTPWRLWDLASGTPAAGANTLEAVGLLERAIAVRDSEALAPHPGLLHMYIHAMEMSPFPERALPAADALRHLVPDAGHLLHMPSHIDILCGQYREAVEANRRAVNADSKVLRRHGPLNFYTLYRCHNYHFLLYAAMFLGQYETALKAAEDMGAILTEDLLRVEEPPMADWLETFVPMKLHVFIRFGRWDAILAEPLPSDPDLYRVTTAMTHYARGVAFAATNHVAEAENERNAFEAAKARVPATRMLFNNTAQAILHVADAMLRGEIAYRRGKVDLAFALLREAVHRDDALPYDEPWGWMQPARHALGALLLEQGRLEEARAVYREDLGLSGTLSRPAQHPDNVWSLHGYVESLHRLGDHAEAHAMEVRLATARSHADVPIHASCYCRLHEH